MTLSRISHTILALTLVTLGSAEIRSEPEIDPEYGYTEQHAILVGGFGAETGPSNERRYLDRLRGPDGEPVSYHRLGSCCPFDSPNAMGGFSALLDRYEVTYKGLMNPAVLYLNMYDAGEVFPPRGFIFSE